MWINGEVINLDNDNSTTTEIEQNLNELLPVQNEILAIHEANTYQEIYDFNNHNIMHHDNPLKFVHKYQFAPLELQNTHFVKAHHVDGYMRSDGTYVKGYFRDGDGNTMINNPNASYVASNPDGILHNNLK